MASLAPTHYVPFLKGKAGEFAALGQLTLEQREALTPLIDVPPEAVKFGREEGERWLQIETVEQALEGYAAQISAAWGEVDTCFVDLAGFDPDLRFEDGAHPVSRFFADAREAKLIAVPVTGPDRHPAQIEAVKGVCAGWRLGSAIRLRGPALERPRRFASGLPALLERLELEPPQVDILVDLGELTKSRLEEAAATARSVIEALPELEGWRSLVLGAGAYPFELAPFVGPDQTKPLPRHDWTLWRELIDSGDPPPRLPQFGDYGASRADWPSAFDFTEMSTSAKIVYTGEEDWLIVKGHETGSGGGSQYPELARRAIALEQFLGEGHCPTERRIIDCAARRITPGNTTQWVSAATRHHIEVVSRQLASSA